MLLLLMTYCVMCCLAKRYLFETDKFIVEH